MRHLLAILSFPPLWRSVDRWCSRWIPCCKCEFEMSTSYKHINTTKLSAKPPQTADSDHHGNDATAFREGVDSVQSALGSHTSDPWPRAKSKFHHPTLTTEHTSNASWCMGIKSEMSGTVCVTFTWYMYRYELFIAFVCFVVCSLL